MGEGFSVWAVAIFGSSLIATAVVTRDSVPIISTPELFSFGGMMEDAG